MQILSYIDRTINEEVLRRAKTCRKSCVKLRERQAKFFGHIMRRDRMKSIITTGMINGRKSRGRKHVKHLDGLRVWLQREKYSPLMHSMRDRKKYREMITNAIQHGT